MPRLKMHQGVPFVFRSFIACEEHEAWNVAPPWRHQVWVIVQLFAQSVLPLVATLCVLTLMLVFTKTLSDLGGVAVWIVLDVLLGLFSMMFAVRLFFDVWFLVSIRRHARWDDHAGGYVFVL